MFYLLYGGGRGVCDWLKDICLCFRGALEVDAGDRAREQKEEELEEGDEERQKLEPQRVCVLLEDMGGTTPVAPPSSLRGQSGLSHACQGPEVIPPIQDLGDIAQCLAGSKNMNGLGGSGGPGGETRMQVICVKTRIE